MKKNQQYHSNDIIFNNQTTQDDMNMNINSKSARKPSILNFATLSRKNDDSRKNKLQYNNKSVDEKIEIENIIRNNKKAIEKGEVQPRCFRIGMTDFCYSKNFTIIGKIVTPETLPEMDIVCGYVQLDLENNGKLVTLYVALFDYELIFYVNEKVKKNKLIFSNSYIILEL